MSNKTFINCFLAWVCSMKIDFRAQVDPWCKHHPKVLACDGTHVGVSVKHLNLDPPITQADLPQKQKVNHKKMDRCLLPYPKKGEAQTVAQHIASCKVVASARLYLHSLVQTVVTGVEVTVHEEDEKKQALLDIVRGRPFLQQVVQTIAERSAPIELIKLLCLLLIPLTTKENALCSIFPFRYHTQLLAFCDAVEQGTHTPQQLAQVMLFATDVGQLLSASLQHQMTELCVGFVRELIAFCQQIHASDIPFAPAVPLEGTYNLPSGVAYYFTHHGCQVRQLPIYDVQRSKLGIQKGPQCRKLYP